MRILAVSPVPSHPQFQGNSSRIHALLRHLQAHGHAVHFLYYALEGLNAPQAAAMAAEWEMFHPLRCSAGSRGSPPAGGWGLDDWYHGELGRAAAELHRLWDFDAVIVNYVWMSAVFEALPPGPLRILDTHDVFGNRQEIFRARGLQPAWYFTSVAEEARGLARADLVVAIQDEEAEHFRRVLQGTRTRVCTLGHLLPQRFLPVPALRRALRVGYLGSDNPLNVRGLLDLLTALQDHPAAREQLEIVVGGPVGLKVPRRLADLARVSGTVRDLAAFYGSVHACVNPMPGGTGLKIKTLEALSFGRAIVGTASAWAGLGKQPPPALCRDENAGLLDALCALAAPDRLAAATQEVRRRFIDYQAGSQLALNGLLAPRHIGDNASTTSNSPDE